MMYVMNTVHEVPRCDVQLGVDWFTEGVGDAADPLFYKDYRKGDQQICRGDSQYKDGLSSYGDFNSKDKTVVRRMKGRK